MPDDYKKPDHLPGDKAAAEDEAFESEAVGVADSELVKLRRELEAKEQEAKNSYDRFLRQRAELENYKKRTAKEKEEAIRFANEYLIRDLLPVADNLERAVDHARGGGNGKPLVEGVEMVLKGLLDVFAKHGVVQITTVGEPFDPAKHEAMAQVESKEHEPNTIVNEHHKGYLFHDRLLRPALVTVAKAVESKAKKNGGSEVENGPADD
jgi:molecular chaperone GrpE